MADPVRSGVRDERRVRVSQADLSSGPGDVRAAVFGAAVGLPLLAGAALYIQFTFDGLVARCLLLAWETVVWVDLAAWVVFLLIGAARRPSQEAIDRVWTPFGRRLADVWSLAVIASVWLFMPPSPPQLRLVLCVLDLTYVILVMIAGAEPRHSGNLPIIGVVGSLAAFFLLDGQPHAAELAFFLVWFGATLLILRRFVHGALNQAKDGRAATERALRLTAAERDARTSFIRAATHDLQQPIQAASLYFDQAFSAAEPAERAAAANGARSAFASTQALLETMLDHLRLEAGAMPVRPEAVPVADVLQRVVRAHAPAAQAAGMRLKAAPSRLVLWADPELTARALGNLVGNAVKHARGERILLAARRGRDGLIDLWVLDDGEGVDPDVENLFADFSQGRSAAQGGFGLGLATVKRIAELMGGRAGCEPAWRSGAAFVLSLREASCASA